MLMIVISMVWNSEKSCYYFLRARSGILNYHERKHWALWSRGEGSQVRSVWGSDSILWLNCQVYVFFFARCPVTDFIQMKLCFSYLPL